MIKRISLSIFISFSLFILISLTLPVEALIPNTTLESLSQQTVYLASLQYEAKETSPLTTPITDPNFNTMRNKEMGKSFAVPLVVGTLLLAVIAPLATWWYFSK